MHRFYVPSQFISADKIIISKGKQFHHLKDVLRLKVNDQVEVFDGQGNDYITKIQKLLAQSAILKIVDRGKVNARGGIHITIACAMPKKSKMEQIIDKLTQLGVDRIIPLHTVRTVVKLGEDKAISRQGRWERVAQSAASQCKRKTLPVIDPVKNIDEVLSEAGEYDLKLIPTLAGKQKSLKEIFVKSKARKLLVLIGPEGDFAPGEVNMAIKAGCIPVTLGNLVMRVETAAVAVASFLRLYEKS